MKFSISAFFMAWIMAVPLKDAFACTCEGTFLEEGVRTCTVLVSGTILSHDLYPVKDTSGVEILLSQSKLKVDRGYKGTVSNDTLIIFSLWDEATCGYTFAIGKKYFVFGERPWHVGDIKDEGTLQGPNITWAYFCSNTGLYSNETDNEIQKLLAKRE